MALVKNNDKILLYTDGVAKYFKELGVAESTTYSILKYSQRETTNRKKESGTEAKNMTARKRESLVNTAISSQHTSERQLAN